jgi:hypothetical protein
MRTESAIDTLERVKDFLLTGLDLDTLVEITHIITLVLQFLLIKKECMEK